MEAKFTPGPWLFIDAEARADYQFSKQCVIRGDGKQIASFSWQTPSKAFPSREESKANARLIAAAPELLEALLTKRDYIADAAAGALTYEGSGEGFIAMAKEDLARVDAAISKATGQQP